jgi:hypothetical protein
MLYTRSRGNGYTKQKRFVGSVVFYAVLTESEESLWVSLCIHLSVQGGSENMFRASEELFETQDSMQPASFGRKVYGQFFPEHIVLS